MITPAKAREELTPITQLEEIWKGFEDRRYTHLKLVVGGEEYELLGKVRGRSAGRARVEFQIKGKEARELAKALRGLGLEDVEPTPSGYLYLYREGLEALLDKGVEAYAVRKAKRGEAMWRVEITYRGVTIALKMTHDELHRTLRKQSKSGRIEILFNGSETALDLGLLAAIREGRADCKDCPEKRLAEALDDIASENLGFSWGVTDGGMTLRIKLPR
ncbi:MAG: hypothetical protein JZD41_00820 [Thermoproteus sp.]|nr:hypothetical protein [Thermoproteus sp.]